MGSIKKPDGSKFEKEEDLDDSILCEFFEKKATANNNNVTVPMLNKMVNKQLWMDMRDECAYSRMDNLFLNYFMIVKKMVVNGPRERTESRCQAHTLKDPIQTLFGIALATT